MGLEERLVWQEEGREVALESVREAAVGERRRIFLPFGLFASLFCWRAGLPA